MSKRPAAKIYHADFFLPNGMPAPPMLTIEETCEILGARKTQLTSWNTRGYLKRVSVQTSRPYRLVDVVRWMKEMPVGQRRNA